MRIIQTIRLPFLVAICAVSLVVLSAGGCSKRPSVPVQAGIPALATNTTDLGAVELTQGVPKQFDLGSGKTCTLTGLGERGSILVEITVSTTNADGSIQDLQMPRITTVSGRQCVVSAGDTAIALTPTLVTK